MALEGDAVCQLRMRSRIRKRRRTVAPIGEAIGYGLVSTEHERFERKHQGLKPKN